VVLCRHVLWLVMASNLTMRNISETKPTFHAKHMVGCPGLKAERDLCHMYGFLFFFPASTVLHKAIRHPLSLSELYKPTHLSLLDLHSPKLGGCCYTTHQREGGKMARLGAQPCSSSFLLFSVGLVLLYLASGSNLISHA
jgi:hypothetical protein